MLWNSFKIAFSMYSKIPMPKTEWNEKNMRYSMCFFPMIGIAIGGILWAFHQLVVAFAFGKLFAVAGYVLIPVFVTGGIHLDGFIDTQDALNSYQSRERKLEILKDSHIGAFALISTLVYFIVQMGVWSELDTKSIEVLCIGFVLSRAFSGLAVVTFSCAKDSGLAKAFSDAAQKRVVQLCMVSYMVLIACFMIYFGRILGIVAIVGAICTFAYYRYVAYKEFGGITGDLAGWFLQLCELVMAIVVLILQVV